MNKILINIMAAFLLLVSGACNKQLNVLPTTSRVDGNAITDLKSAKTVLNGVYYRFANGGTDNNSVPGTFWFEVQQQLPSILSNMIINSQGPEVTYEHTYNPTTFRMDAIWKWCYNTINAANGFLKNVEPVNIESAAKKQMIAEAKFLRGFSLSTLLLYYGEYNNPDSKFGVIIRDEFLEAGSINKSRATIAECYQKIMEDLDAAIADLPETRAEKLYATKAAAQLMKARLLINRGAAGDFESVVAITTDLIDNSGYSLEDNLKDIFQNKKFNSNEVILGIQPIGNQTPVFTSYQYYHEWVASENYVSIVENDPRSTWVYKIADDRYVGPTKSFTKYYSGDPDNIAPDGNSEYGYAFRLTEAYLLKAEALARIGTDLVTPKDLLKEVKGKAGVTDFSDIDAATTADEIIFLIVRENFANFIGEAGQDWLAMRRLPLATIQQLMPTILSSTQLTLPIPQEEVSENKQVVQSPGYN